MNDSKEHINYDQQHDILYIHFNNDPKIGYEDEISPGIFLRKDEESDKVLGVIIMGYRKRMEGGRMMKWFHLKAKNNLLIPCCCHDNLRHTITAGSILRADLDEETDQYFFQYNGHEFCAGEKRDNDIVLYLDDEDVELDITTSV